MAAVVEGDNATVVNVAHTLKSAAASMGALHLAGLSQSLETSGLGADASRCSALAQGLQAALALTEQAIAPHVAGLFVSVK